MDNSTDGNDPPFCHCFYPFNSYPSMPMDAETQQWKLANSRNSKIPCAEWFSHFYTSRWMIKLDLTLCGAGTRSSVGENIISRRLIAPYQHNSKITWYISRHHNLIEECDFAFLTVHIQIDSRTFSDYYNDNNPSLSPCHLRPWNPVRFDNESDGLCVAWNEDHNPARAPFEGHEITTEIIQILGYGGWS